MTAIAHPPTSAPPEGRPPLVPLPPPAAGATERRPSPGWKAQGLVDVSWPWFLGGVAVAVLVQAAESGVDLLLIKSAFDPVIGANEGWSWLAAAAITLGSVVLAVEAGRLQRKHRADGSVSAAWPRGLLLVWAVVGAGLFLFRWRAADLDVPQVVFEGGASPPENTSGHLLLAVVLATFHLLAGATAFAQGYFLTNPEAFALRTARWRHRSVPARLAEAEAVTTRLAHNLGTRLTALAEADQAAETAKETRRAVAAHVQACVRVRIAQHLGQPSATGVIRHLPEAPIPLAGVD